MTEKNLFTCVFILKKKIPKKNIKNPTYLRPIWEIFLSYRDFYHQNWEKYIFFALGTDPFMEPR